MDPTRSTRSSSRRSSILKPAKPRQALQNLNFNTSSNESSPTTKLKRRVSFAEKKHVKEFCNSVEQGTVWDNTYEEHDLSNLKPLCAPNGKEREGEDASKGNAEFNESCNETIYLNSETINECSIQGSNGRFATDRSIRRDLDGEDSDLDFTNIVENIQSVHGLVTQKEELPKASSVVFSNKAEQMRDSVSPTDLQSNSSVRRIISVYQDPCTDVAKETSEPSRPNVHDLSCSNLNATTYQDINMDFTEIVCSADTQDNESEETRKNTSIEFTQSVPTSMDIEFDPQDIIFDSQYRINKLNKIETEEMDQDMSMDATVAIPSILKSAINNDNAELAAYSTDDRTVKFNNVSMEATVAIPSIFKSAINNDNAEVAAYSTDDRTVKFNNISMEATVAIPSILKSAINNDNAEIAAYSTDDRTVKFNNISMEATVAIPSILKSAINNDNAAVAAYSTDDRTVKFNNVSMEATVAIPSILKSAINNDNAAVAAYSTDDRTVKFNNVSMEATVAIPSIFKSAINNDNAEVAAYSTDDKTVKFNNVSVEATVAIPSILKSAINNDNAEVAAYFTDDRTVKFNNVSMEVTSAVPTILRNVQQSNINQSENWELNLGPSDDDCRSIIFHNTSMEMTKPVKISSRKETPCPDNAHRLSTIQKVPQSKYNVTCVDEETMEVTKAVAVNVHSKNQGINAMHCEVTAVDSNSGELRGGGNSYKTMVDFEESMVCDDEAMEFTTAIGTLYKERTNNFKNDEPAKIMFYPRRSSHNSIPDDLRDDANSDKTRVFHNNSMTTTAVVSSLNVKDTCQEEEEIDLKSEINDQEIGRTVLLPNMSMEITEAVTALRNRDEMENIVDLTKDEESPIFEKSRSSNLSREPLDHSAVPDNVLRDITAIVVPSENSDSTSNEMNCNVDNLRKLNEVQNSINTRTSMALHGLIEQDICASAFEENNKPAACAPFNSASNGDIRAATSEVIQTESLRHESSQVIVTHSRRTYTLKSYSTGNKGKEITEMNVDTSCYKTNDKENRVHILNEIGNLQDNEYYREQSSMEKSITFFGNNVEELESIKPPSFMCLDDSLYEDTLVKVSYCQEVNRETDCLANTVKRSENIECEGPPKFTFDYLKCNLVQSNQVNSQTFPNKHTLLESESDSSKLVLEDQRLQNYTNADVRVLECSSSTVNDIERFPIPEIAKDLEDMEMKEIGADNSNVEAQRMDCPSEIKNTGEGARGDQNLSNAMATESRESSEPRVLSVENNISIELDPFSKLTKELKIRAQSDEIIWDVYHENIEKRVFVIGFISCSLLVAIYLRDDCDAASVQFIKDIRIISRLADDADVLISIVHWLILEKLDAVRLMNLYKTSEDILPLLDYISKEIKLAMDFMFDIIRLEDTNLMEITRDSISFVSRTKRMDIILRVTINIRPFDKIESQDISVHCLLGSVREDDIKKLIINIKRDHKFLRRFMNDVREYIYLMEESSNMIKKSY